MFKILFNRRHETGISLTELLIVLALMGCVLGIGMGWYAMSAQTVQGDADLRILEWQIKLARETAINQRRSVEVQFVPPNTIRVVRRNLPNGTTLLSTAVLEHNARFHLFASMADTPDGFGRAAEVWFGGPTVVMFTSDGMFTDAAGNPVNGSIFLGQPGRRGTARALTIFGPTSRISTYRWNGSEWRR